MTPAVGSYEPASGLSPFEGSEVVKTSVAIRNTGDGLSKALEVDPVEIALGDTVWIAVQADCVSVDFKPMKDAEDTLQRVHVLRATDCTLVDAQVVQEQINRQRDRIIKAREEAAGIMRLELGDGSDEDE